MIDTLIGALKISLNKCNSYEHPGDYIYQINQVLNRFKSNLFKLIPDKEKHLYDAKEFIQFRICLSWKFIPSMGSKVVIKERSPVMLHVNGFIPSLGLRKNRENTFIKAVDISNIINLDKIADIKTDYFIGNNYGSNEIDNLSSHLGDLNNVSFYCKKDEEMDATKSISIQISAMASEETCPDPRSVVFEHDKIKTGTSGQRLLDRGRTISEILAREKLSAQL